MGVILLKRCEKLATETELDFAIRVLTAFQAGSEANAAAASAESQGPVIEAYKRGKADGLREGVNLASAVAQECSFREQEAAKPKGDLN